MGRISDVMALMNALAGSSERICAEPARLEEEFEVVVSTARDSLRLDEIGLWAEVSERTAISSGDAAGVRTPPPGAREFPLMRGKVRVGTLWAIGENGDALDEEQVVGLRALAGFGSLAVEAARARELAAVRAAHGSLVQLASEALGKILDEDRLYKTVLVLALELMDATGGAVLLEDGGVVGVGDIGEDPEIFEKVELSRREPWIGRLGARHAVGVPVGREGGALFLVREDRAYTATEGVSLKLVARQLDRARERSRLYAAREKTMLDTIAALAATLEMRDGTTGEHILRTQDLAGSIADVLELSPERGRVVRYAAVLHDIGKVGIPDAILNKPDALDSDEWDFMRRHPKIGADVVGRIEGLEEISAVVLAHHERYDGRGYPAGVQATDIPVEARIIAVVDTYDAMTNDRPYRRALSHEEALAELAACAGSQFDPDVVEALVSVMRNSNEEDEHE